MQHCKQEYQAVFECIQGKSVIGSFDLQNMASLSVTMTMAGNVPRYIPSVGLEIFAVEIFTDCFDTCIM